jgi:hypothetical protein
MRPQSVAGLTEEVQPTFFQLLTDGVSQAVSKAENFFPYLHTIFIFLQYPMQNVFCIKNPAPAGKGIPSISSNNYYGSAV